jgi:hypothetical protein
LGKVCEKLADSVLVVDNDNTVDKFADDTQIGVGTSLDLVAQLWALCKGEVLCYESFPKLQHSSLAV